VNDLLAVSAPMESRFANPHLAEIVKAAEFRPRKSVAKSILYEAVSWLVLPAVIAFFVFALVLFEFIFSSMCRPPDIALQYFIANSLVKLACGYNPILTPIYMILKVAMVAGTYNLAASVFFQSRRLARRYRLNALDDLRSDPRDPVLYLRSFATEVDANPERRSRKTYEEDFALVLNFVGPVVAIGEPTESLPILGATRIYLENDKWQESVERLISISKLVVIQAGLSEGLMWEIGTVARKVEPTKLLISLLTWQGLHDVTRRARYKQFKERVTKILTESRAGNNISLPDDVGNASFLTFGPDWKPELVEAKKWKRRFFYFSKSILMNETLRSVLKKRGVYLRRWKTNLYSTYILSVLLYPVIYRLFTLIFREIMEKQGNDSLALLIIVVSFILYSAVAFTPYFVLMYWLLAKLLMFIFHRIIGKRNEAYTSIKMNE
jgi:hypothetical protein